MTTAKKIIFALIGVGLLAGIVSFVATRPTSQNAGTTNQVNQVRQDIWWFVQKTYFGSSQQTSLDSTGALTTSASATFTGLFSVAKVTVTGNVNSTSTSATSQTLKAADIATYSELALLPTAGAVTLTLPASSTLSTFLPTSGNRTTLTIANATTTAAQTITLVGASGMILNAATSSTKTIYPNRSAELSCTRLPSTDIMCILYGI